MMISYNSIIKSTEWKAAVVILITLCALFLGFEKSDYNQMSKHTTLIIDYIFTMLFTVEIAIRMLAAKDVKAFFKIRDKQDNPNYFDADGLWNIFDFALVVGSIASIVIQLFMNESSHIEIFFVARLLRVGRVLRLLEVHEEIKKIERKILSVLPTIASFLVLFGAIIFTYAIIGSHLFGECNKCGNMISNSFADIGSSLLTVVQLITLDGWSEIMKEVQKHSPILGTIYFLSFIFLIGIVFLNIFMAVLVNRMENNLEEKDNSESRKMESKINSLENEIRAMKLESKTRDDEIIRLLKRE